MDAECSLMRWLSLGRGEEYAVSMTVLEDSLFSSIASLRRATPRRVIDMSGGALLLAALTIYGNVAATRLVSISASHTKASLKRAWGCWSRL